jgi:hypothetical protein
VSEIHGEVVCASLPRGILRSWDLAMPLEHIDCAIWIFNRFSNKAKGMITAPFLALLLEPIDDQLVDLLLLH